MLLIDENNETLGKMPIYEARNIAFERGYDIVEIAANADPPVCKLMDYSKYRYEQTKRDNENRRKQKIVEVELKEIRLRPQIDTHDIRVKMKKIVEFLTDGNKVRVYVQFKGREIMHPEIGRNILESILEQLKPICSVERMPVMEGKNLWMILAKSPQWDPAKTPFQISINGKEKDTPKQSEAENEAPQEQSETEE